MHVAQGAGAVAGSDQWRVLLPLTVTYPADVLTEGEGRSIRAASLHGWGWERSHIIQFLRVDGRQEGGRSALGVRG